MDFCLSLAKREAVLTSDFDYHLPPELIAQQPLPQRDQSRLLVLDRANGSIRHSTFSRLPDHLSPGDCLVLNDSRVLPAAFRANRSTGGNIQGLFLSQSQGLWQVMLRPSARLRQGESLDLLGYPGQLILTDSLGKGQWSARVEPSAPVLQILEQIGHTPLPPYIKRQPNCDDPSDRQRYQTIFAQQPGSVAAPTAGLHFNQKMFNSLQAKGINKAYLTLHVGLGTFAPITAENIDQHRMHSEYFSISADTVSMIQAARSTGHRRVAVGSTSLRVLESASATGKLTPQQGCTDIYIKPGYKFAATDAMLTNFHVPRSTLLVLVCALASPELIFEAYQQAIDRKYRFYSYGDAMLIL